MQANEQTAYRICTRCVMDTSDPLIEFDTEGVCNHCRRFDELLKPNWMPDERGARLLQRYAEQIRKYGRRHEYDCVIGVSGGVDSSYLLHVAKETMGLRPLAVHVDAGWNSELAVQNIECLTKGLGIELFTYVVDWEEMRDLQVAYLRAGVPNQDVPQDHAFFAKLYEFAVKRGIKYVVTGANTATESVLPVAWGYNATDGRQLRAIHRQFGTRPLSTFPISGLLKSYVYYPYFRGMRVIRPLDLIDYKKDKAIDFLSGQYGWKYYGGKHFESRWTRFFQSYYLPIKFGYDKRRAHLASLVLSGQIERDEALVELRTPSYDEKELPNDLEYIAKKLELSVFELESLIRSPNRRHVDYPSNRRIEAVLRSLKNLTRRIGAFG